MSNEVGRASVACGVCGAQVVELRRGRCWHCYSQWAELRPVGKGATCALCAERRRDQLRLVELHGRSVCFCHSCAARALKMAPLPHSIEEIRAALSRERRADERRSEGVDLRIFPRERRDSDRRGLARERRAGAREEVSAPLASVDELIEIQEDDVDIIDQTVVQERAQDRSSALGEEQRAVSGDA